MIIKTELIVRTVVPVPGALTTIPPEQPQKLKNICRNEILSPRSSSPKRKLVTPNLVSTHLILVNQPTSAPDHQNSNQELPAILNHSLPQRTADTQRILPRHTAVDPHQHIHENIALQRLTCQPEHNVRYPACERQAPPLQANTRRLNCSHI